MLLALRMLILYPLFAYLAGTGISEIFSYDQASDFVTVRFTLESALQAGAGVLGYAGTWLASRFSKWRGGAT